MKKSATTSKDSNVVPFPNCKGPTYGNTKLTVNQYIIEQFFELTDEDRDRITKDILGSSLLASMTGMRR